MKRKIIPVWNHIVNLPSSPRRIALIALLGGALLIAGCRGQTSEPSEPLATADLAPAAETPTPQPTATFTPSPTPEATATPAQPQMGTITFALAVDENLEPLDPTDTFDEGVVEIHAIFEYSNLSREHVWERVWYLDGLEILSSSENWSADEAGVFDYFLEAGGDPLPPGEWLLELYVDGALVTQGAFNIKAIQVAIADTPTPTTAPTVTPTLTPTATTPPPPPPRAYQLAYTKWNGFHHNIYIADTNGRNERFIASRAAGPSWSADGKQLFFYAEEGFTQQEREGPAWCEFGTISDGIVAIDLPPVGDICQPKTGPWFCERKGVDTNAPPHDVCTEGGISVFQNLDWKEGTARWANVAPDASAVAYDAHPGGPDYRIYFRSILNEQQSNIEIVGEQADWSPDGQRLVYRSGRNNQVGIWISNRDDTNPIRITDDGSDSFPAWSPDDRTIAFSREFGGNVDIYLVNTDGSNLRRLTDAPNQDTLPTYAPNGEIIFRSARSGSWGIWRMSGTGGNQREIIPDAGLGSDWANSRMDVR